MIVSEYYTGLRDKEVIVSNSRWLGLESIKLGVVGLASSANYMPTTFTTILNIVPDSAKIMFEVPAEVEILVEDSPDPDIVLSNGSIKKTIEFATRDMDSSSVLLNAFGGSVSGETYSFPTDSTSIRVKAIECKTEVVNGYYYKVQIPKANVRAGAELRMYNTNPDTGEVGFQCTVQKAVTAGGTILAPMKIIRVSG